MCFRGDFLGSVRITPYGLIRRNVTPLAHVRNETRKIEVDCKKYLRFIHVHTWVFQALFLGAN